MKKACASGAMAVAVIIAVFIAGCTSSTSPSSTQTAGAGGQLPTANVGPSQTIKVGKAVTLDGSGSSSPNGGALTYNWSLSSVPTNSSAQIANSTSVHPTFTLDKTGSYVVQLVVTDDAGAQSRAASTIITGMPAEPSKTTLIVQPSKTELYLGEQQTISGKLIDANGQGIPNQTISFKVQAHVLGFTTDYPMNDTKTDSAGAFTQTETVSRHDAPSFVTDVNLEAWAVYGGNELYAPATSPHTTVEIHLTPSPSS